MDNCLQMYSPYELNMALVEDGRKIETEIDSLIYEKKEKIWVVKVNNSRERFIKFKYYENKKEAQTFIRGRKRRLQKRRELYKYWKNTIIDFEFSIN